MKTTKKTPGTSRTGVRGSSSGTRQRARLEAYVRQHGSVSTPEARDNLNILHPSGRIKEMAERDGHIFKKEMVPYVDPEGGFHEVARYFWLGQAQK